jgi:hypothetical protein
MSCTPECWSRVNIENTYVKNKNESHVYDTLPVYYITQSREGINMVMYTT